MKVTLLGLTCVNCIEIRKMLSEVISKYNLVIDLEELNDLNSIAKYAGQIKVRLVPALLVDDQLKLQGRVPTEVELLKFLGLDDSKKHN